MPHSALLRGLYVVTDERLAPHLSIARAALQGGARILQLRDKTTPIREILPIAQEIRALTKEFGATFIINDRVDLALWCEADGVHLGPDDWPIEAARKVLGPNFLIGSSCGTREEAEKAVAEGADYLGVGAVFGTQTKSDAGAAIGISGLNAVRGGAAALPCAAIGGLNLENIASVAQTGVEMLCVVSAIAGAGSESKMERATRELLETFQP